MRPFDELRDLVLIVKLRVLEPVERPDRIDKHEKHHLYQNW